MDNPNGKEIRTKYFYVRKGQEIQTSIGLSQAESDLFKKNNINKRLWIQEQHNLLFKKYCSKFGDNQANTPYCRKNIQLRIKKEIYLLIVAECPDF